MSITQKKISEVMEISQDLAKVLQQQIDLLMVDLVSLRQSGGSEVEIAYLQGCISAKCELLTYVKQ